MDSIPKVDALYSELTYEQQLAYTQNIKQQLLDGLMTSGMSNVIPTDKDSIESMMKVMNSMDKVTLTDRRNDIDTEGNVNAKELLGTMADFIRNAKNSNPFAVAAGENLVGIEPPVADDDLPDFEFVPGQEVVGVVVETYEEFDSRMASVHAEELKEREKRLDLE